ncbi:hypothetical protein [Brevibacterium zhoupengii]|uniref:hypothetical protein n=1 Tax=Brevibacterium zhoupengii TaxID=2898795 RepID=UPI001E59D8A4|nr:hypothetical protein [Brevibacterium zhoupengii]
MTNFDSPQLPAPRQSRLGFPLIAIVGLALLAVPRVVLHDLDLISEGGFLNAVLVFLPPLIWIAVVLWKRPGSPFLTLLIVGAFYGVFLALGHQILWNISFRDNPPQLGGNLTALAPGLQSVIMRTFATISSLFTGVIVGAITGLLAWGLSVVLRRR